MEPSVASGNVSNCRGGFQKLAKISDNCDLQVCLYQIYKADVNSIKQQHCRPLQMVDDPTKSGTAENNLK